MSVKEDKNKKKIKGSRLGKRTIKNRGRGHMNSGHTLLNTATINRVKRSLQSALDKDTMSTGDEEGCISKLGHQ